MKKLFFFFLILSNVAFAQYEDFKVDALLTPHCKPVVITVGGSNADIPGYTNRAIQIAVDALPAEGGTVKLNEGTFIIKGAVRLKSNVKLIGSGDATVLKRGPGFKSKMAVDADYGEIILTVEDASGFEPGMDVQVWDDPQKSCWRVSIAKITEVKGNTIYTDRGMIADYWCRRNGWVSNAGSGVYVRDADNVYIADFMVDGNKKNTVKVDGCNNGGIAVFKSKNVTIDNVHIKDFNGEGISWQITENVTVQNCEIEGCANMGMHPGTGSPKSKILNNNSHDNAVDGMYICWRAHHSIVRGNKFHHNGRYGICNGHKDSDIIFEDNHIYENGSEGINFRINNAKNSPHNNTLINNVIENNGQKEPAYGIGIYSLSENMIIKNNIIRDTKNGTQKGGIFISKVTPEVTIEGNEMSGHPEGDIIKEK
jgi:hypothetical protein